MDIINHERLTILIQLAKADGKVSPPEKKFIYSIGDRKGFSKARIDDMFANTDSIGSLGALSLQTIKEYLHEMMFLMISDGIIHESEVLFCQQIGIKLGYQKSSVDRVIRQIQQGKSEEEVRDFIEDLPHPAQVG
ncbi:MAG: TerB family tellurite resistance protein [Proteobacteria bacterium]|nr:TerB family tellurite resistance protein [Pseudomonadota bacterium]